MNTNKAVLQVVKIFIKVVLIVVIMLGIVRLGQMAYVYSHAVFYQESMEEAPGRNVSLELKKDVSSKDLARFLEENGIVEDAAIFRVQMKVLDFDDTVKAGKYELNTSMTPKEILEVLDGTEKEDKK
ncbi:MAG: endolytic transglycosylase MltG [Lachnospiraceae bacterium]